MGESLADEELTRRAVAGDSQCFVALCERHRARVWRIAASVAGGPDAEDLAQEVIVRAFCSLRKYRGDAPFEAWLCRIAVNAAYDYQRSAWKRRVFLVAQPAELEQGECDSAEGEAERRDLQRRVRQSVALLPEKQRVPIWLHYFEGFTLVHVARVEGVPEATIRSRVRAGLRRLGVSLGDLLPPAEGGTPFLVTQRAEG